MATTLVKFLTDVYVPYCKGDVVRLEDDVLAQVDKVAKSRKIKQAYEVYKTAVAEVEQGVKTAEGDVTDEVAKLSRSELNAKAAAAGVDSPEALPNKQAVVDAISATTAPADPATKAKSDVAKATSTDAPTSTEPTA